MFHDDYDDSKCYGIPYMKDTLIIIGLRFDIYAILKKTVKNFY